MFLHMRGTEGDGNRFKQRSPVIFRTNICSLHEKIKVVLNKSRSDQ